MNPKSDKRLKQAHLFDQLNAYRDRVAIIDQSYREYSYTLLLEIAEQFAKHYIHSNLVIIQCDNSPASIAAYVAAIQSHTPVLLLSTDIHEQALKALLSNYDPSLIICPTSLSSSINYGKQLEEIEGHTIIQLGRDKSTPIHPDLALLLTTSGSTGSPTLIRISHKNLIANTQSIAKFLNIKENDRAITTLPMNYSYGLSIINTHLACGGSIVATNHSIVSRGFWGCMKDLGITTFGGVPFTYQTLWKMGFHKLKLPHIRYLTQAGGNLDSDLTLKLSTYCKIKDINFIVMYGQTEATARISYLPSEYTSAKPGSIGKAIPGGALWLEDDQGGIITEPNQPGELVYQGDNVSMGSAVNRSDLSRGDNNHGILHTGDIALFDEDEFFTIVGRKNRMLKVFGTRVNLDDLEKLLAQGGYETYCSGSDDAIDIYTTQKAEIEILKEYVTEHTTISPNGIRVHYLEAVPRNTAGKVLYNELQKYSP